VSEDLTFNKKHYLHIGGLVAMAFSADEGLLFVVTHSGRGIFDLTTGERVARDYEETYPKDGAIDGIGPLAGISIEVAEYNLEDDLVLISPSGTFRVTGEPSGIQVEERA
jgi:hypothetical protein